MHIADKSLDRALDCFTQELAVARQLHSMKGIQSAYGHMAHYHATAGRLGAALAYLRKKEVICRDAGLADSLQKTWKSIAALCLQRGDSIQSIATCVKRTAFCREKRMLAALCDSLIDEAYACHLSNRVRPATVRAREAWAIASQNGFATLEARAKALLETAK